MEFDKESFDQGWASVCETAETEELSQEYLASTSYQNTVDDLVAYYAHGALIISLYYHAKFGEPLAIPCEPIIKNKDYRY